MRGGPQIEKSDDFVARLQGQLAAQQLRIDGMHERLIAERDRASILEAQRRQLIEEVLVPMTSSIFAQYLELVDASSELVETCIRACVPLSICVSIQALSHFLVPKLRCSSALVKDPNTTDWTVR